jgi:drug/metabolite transporter (DMT)-like permease
MTGPAARALPWQALLDGLAPARRGAVIYITAGLVFVATDSLTKSLVAHIPVVHVVFGRHVTYLLAVLLIAGGRHPRRLLATKRPWTQLARGLAMFISTATYFLALSMLPMAEVSALGSTAPLMVIALAGPLLGERVSRFAIGGTLLGFGGVVILAGLDPTHLDAAVLVPLASSFALAIFSLLTRSLRTDPTNVTVFCSGLVGLAAATVLELVVPTASSPKPAEWVGIGIVGLTALTGHRLLVSAYRWGRASDLAPLGYLSLVWSFLIGTFVFGEALLLRAVVGAGAIATGGVIALRSAPPAEAAAPALVDYAGPLDDQLGGRSDAS